MKQYVITVVLLALCCMTPAKALSVSAHSAILMDADTGQVLYEKNAQEKSLIASTTKIMTALVVLEQGELDETVCVPAEAVGIIWMTDRILDMMRTSVNIYGDSCAAVWVAATEKHKVYTSDVD